MVVDIAANPDVLPIDLPGHAYDATASCMNSMLNSATQSAITRVGWENFIGFEFLLNL